jgi:hypothetical protein
MSLTNTKFFLKEDDGHLTFQKDAKGQVVGHLMEQSGGRQRELKKTK